MLKCNVCGEEFQVTKEGHYISRDNGTSGVMDIFFQKKRKSQFMIPLTARLVDASIFPR